MRSVGREVLSPSRWSVPSPFLQLEAHPRTLSLLSRAHCLLRRLQGLPPSLLALPVVAEPVPNTKQPVPVTKQTGIDHDDVRSLAYSCTLCLRTEKRYSVNLTCKAMSVWAVSTCVPTFLDRVLTASCSFLSFSSAATLKAL